MRSRGGERSPPCRTVLSRRRVLDVLFLFLTASARYAWVLRPARRGASTGDVGRWNGMRRLRVRSHQPGSRGPRDSDLRALRPVCEELAGRSPADCEAGATQARPEVKECRSGAPGGAPSSIARGRRHASPACRVARNHPGTDRKVPAFLGAPLPSLWERGRKMRKPRARPRRENTAV
jgi:hypothetical protein